MFGRAKSDNLFDKFWKDLDDSEKLEEVSKSFEENIKEERARFLESLLLFEEGVPEFDSRHDHKKIPEWRKKCWPELREKYWTDENANIFIERVQQSGNTRLNREMVYQLTVRHDYSKEYDHHHKIIQGFIVDGSITNDEIKNTVRSAIMSRVPNPKELGIKILMHEAVPLVAKQSAAETLASINRQYWAEDRVIDSLKENQQAHADHIFPTLSWLLSEDDAVNALEKISKDDLNQYKAVDRLQVAAARLQGNEKAYEILVRLLKQQDKWHIRLRILSCLTLYHRENKALPPILSDTIRIPGITNPLLILTCCLISFYKDKKKLSEALDFWEQLDTQLFIRSIDIFFGNFSADGFPRLHEGTGDKSDFQLTSMLLQKIVFRNSILNVLLQEDKFWKTIKSKISMYSESDAYKLKRKVNRYLDELRAVPHENFGACETVFKPITIPYYPILSYLNHPNTATSNSQQFIDGLKKLSFRPEIRKICPPPVFGVIDLQNQEDNKELEDWLKSLSKPIFQEISSEHKDKVIQRLGEIDNILGFDLAQSKTAAEFVVEILTTYDMEKTFEERTATIGLIAEVIKTNPISEKVKQLLEEYLCAEDWAYENHNEIYEEVYELALNEQDPRFARSDYGDYGEPLYAFGPEANAWLVLLDFLWSKKDAIDFAVLFINRDIGKNSQFSIERIVIQIATKYPNDPSMAKALIDFAEREEATHRVVYLAQFFFHDCKTMVPLIKEQLQSDNVYRLKESFRALCRNLKNSPEEWEYLVGKFKSSTTATKVPNAGYYFVGKLYDIYGLENLISNYSNSTKLTELVVQVLQDDKFEERRYAIQSLLRKYEHKFSEKDKEIITKQWPAREEQ
jgi:hypothetical protein